MSVQKCILVESFAAFERLLEQPGSWVGAFDFPFGQPYRLVENLGWPLDWSEYVQKIGGLGKQGFEEIIKEYMAGRAVGDKLHYREVDRLARAISPMQMYRVPVGKMFYEGATRLQRSEISIVPCRPTQSSKIALEGYPALVARYLIGKKSYKQDQRGKQSRELEEARRELVRGLFSYRLEEGYGVVVEMEEGLREEIVKEPMGDRLDAVLCAVQAAWACTRSKQNYGAPEDRHLEGWIIDPDLDPDLALS